MNAAEPELWLDGVLGIGLVVLQASHENRPINRYSIHAYIRTYIHAYTRTYMHGCIHAYIHMGYIHNKKKFMHMCTKKSHAHFILDRFSSVHTSQVHRACVLKGLNSSVNLEDEAGDCH